MSTRSRPVTRFIQKQSDGWFSEMQRNAHVLDDWPSAPVVKCCALTNVNFTWVLHDHLPTPAGTTRYVCVIWMNGWDHRERKHASRSSRKPIVTSQSMFVGRFLPPQAIYFLTSMGGPRVASSDMALSVTAGCLQSSLVVKVAGPPNSLPRWARNFWAFGRAKLLHHRLRAVLLSATSHSPSMQPKKPPPHPGPMSGHPFSTFAKPATPRFVGFQSSRRLRVLWGGRSGVESSFWQSSTVAEGTIASPFARSWRSHATFLYSPSSRGPRLMITWMRITAGFYIVVRKPHPRRPGVSGDALAFRIVAIDVGYRAELPQGV